VGGCVCVRERESWSAGGWLVVAMGNQCGLDSILSWFIKIQKMKLLGLPCGRTSIKSIPKS